MGSRLKELRDLLDMTQADFGRMFELTGEKPGEQVSRWESGKQNPALGTRRRVCGRYGWPLEMLQYGGPRPGSVNLRLTSLRLPNAKGVPQTTSQQPGAGSEATGVVGETRFQHLLRLLREANRLPDRSDLTPEQLRQLELEAEVLAGWTRKVRSFFGRGGPDHRSDAEDQGPK